MNLPVQPQHPATDMGISLHRLLNRVGAVIKQGIPGTYWVHAEILKADKRNYWSLELSSYDTGDQKAKARAMIWGSNNGIVDKFEQATGSSLTSGLKILFQCTVQFHSEYGLSLVITDIDPRFTLGDMEAKLQAIRARLTQLGEINLNRHLPPPVEFCRVAVIAPHEAAGLGDFRSQADKLSNHKLCQFDYFTAQFQGDRVSESLIHAMKEAVQRHRLTTPYDALVIIRGGGDKAGLYQLNEAKIARGICRCPIPVFVGVGHERDTTVLDEVAHRYFPTPSLVISHIGTSIIKNARDAQQHIQQLQKAARRLLVNAQQEITHIQNSMSHYAHQQLAISKQSTLQLREHISHTAVASVQQAKQQVSDAYAGLRYMANQEIAQSKQQVQSLQQAVMYNATVSVQNAKHPITQYQQTLHQSASLQLNRAEHHLNEHKMQLEASVPGIISQATHQVATQYQQLLSQSTHQVTATKSLVQQHHRDLLTFAREKTLQAQYEVTRLIEQVLLQDPQKILARGFSLVKSSAGKPIIQASNLVSGQKITIQFNDGDINATIEDSINE